MEWHKGMSVELTGRPILGVNVLSVVVLLVAGEPGPEHT